MSRPWIGIVLLLAGAGLGGVMPVLAAAAGVAPAAPESPPSGPVDLVIRNGVVLDGTGAPAVDADVVIDDGRIRYVGDVGRAVRAGRVIDAAGRVVAPGFIDPHGHGDPLTTPAFENFLAMGVTTITLGHDGAGPVVDDLGAWLDDVAVRGIGVNLAMLVGHGTLREQAGIGTRVMPDLAGIERLRERLERVLDRTFGLSLGLDAAPGRFADELELRMLAGIVGARDRLLVGRLRHDDDREIQRALEEYLRQGNHARLHIAQLASVGGVGPLRAEQLLSELDLARRQGMRVTADVVPSGASPAGSSGGVDAGLQDRLLQDPHVAISSEGGHPATPADGRAAFAWVIESHVRAKGQLTLPEAVRKMTSLPAGIVGIADRGRIAPGLAADVVIFDPARVHARPAESPASPLAEGFDVVIVNGRVAREAGRLDAARHGSVLRP